MSIIKLFDYLSVLALALLSFGILEQWWNIRKTRAIHEIVFSEVVIRFVVSAILVVKLFFLKDAYLLIGQILFMVAVTIYLATLLIIKHKKKQF